MRFFSLRKKKKIPAGESTTEDVVASGASQTPTPASQPTLVPDPASSTLPAPAPAPAVAVETAAASSAPPLLNTINTEPGPEEGEIAEGLRVLVNKSAIDTQCIDIVALHGLGGDLIATWTWTDKKTSLNWLSDKRFLAKDISNARIMTFGYNSARYFSRSEADVRDFASGLLIALKSKRRGRGEKNRPIIFLCHSLGGLVFKQVSEDCAPPKQI